MTDRGRPVKYHRDLLLSVPEKLEAGRTLDDIAAEMHTSRRTLLQNCRRANIFVACEKPMRLKLPVDVELRLRRKAEELAVSDEELVLKLMEVICRDDLFGAVLD